MKRKEEKRTKSGWLHAFEPKDADLFIETECKYICVICEHKRCVAVSVHAFVYMCLSAYMCAMARKH